MDGSTIVWLLAIFTLGAGVAFGIWQRINVAKAKKEHHHSALTEGHPELRRTDGAPGVDPQ